MKGEVIGYLVAVLQEKKNTDWERLASYDNAVHGVNITHR